MYKFPSRALDRSQSINCGVLDGRLTDKADVTLQRMFRSQLFDLVRKGTSNGHPWAGREMERVRRSRHAEFFRPTRTHIPVRYMMTSHLGDGGEKRHKR